MKGILGIQGFADRIDQERVKVHGRLDFPDLSSTSKWAGNTITVGQTSEMFSRIQDAIDWIRDASETQQYVIVIAGGEYSESLVLPGWIHLWSFGTVYLTTDSTDTAITVTGGKTWMFGITVLPESGTAPAISCSDAELNFLRNAFRRGIVATGDSKFAIDFNTVGAIIHSGGGDFELRVSNTGLYGGVSVTDSSQVVIRIISTSLIGQLSLLNSPYKLQIHNTWFLDPYSRPLLYLDPSADASSYVRMQGGLLSTDAAVASIARNGSSGTVQVWSTHNSMSSAYGANVNENFATTYNIVDAQIDAFRFG